MNRIPPTKNISRFQVPLNFSNTSQQRLEEMSSVKVGDGLENFRTELSEMFENLGNAYKSNTEKLVDRFNEVQKKEFSSVTEENTARNTEFNLALQGAISKMNACEEIKELEQLVKAVSAQQASQSCKLFKDISNLQVRLQKMQVKPSKRKVFESSKGKKVPSKKSLK